MAQYTAAYSPWMRHAVRIICFAASLITLSIAVWDLYKNFPIFRDFLDSYFKETQVWVGRILQEKYTIFMSNCLYVAWPLKLVYDGLKN